MERRTSPALTAAASRARRLWTRGVVITALLALVAMVAAPAQAINCLTEKMKAEAPRTGAPSPPPPGLPTAPPPEPQVGDSWLWWLWYFVGGPPHAEQKMCTVRGMGENVYVMVNDEDWNVWVDQADVDQIVANWDNSSYGNWPNQGIYQLVTGNFGPAPDVLDHDPRIYVMLYDWDTSQADGYWNQDDERPASQYPYSNECEVVYVDASTSHPGGPSGAYLTAVMAHEFTHMVEWNGDRFENAWLNEGLSELAMWFYGHPDAITGFNGNPDNNLTSFAGGGADYIKTYLFCLYFYEHFGGSPTLLYLVANDDRSLTGVQSTLQQMGYSDTVAEVVRDWATANYLDDPTIGGGRYNYEGEDLPAFNAVIKSSYPVSPVVTTLNHWAGEYVKFTNGRSQQLHFDGGDGVLWYTRAIKYIAGVPQSLEDMLLDGTSAGLINLFEFGTGYDQVVMVVVNASGSGSTSYEYSTTDIPTGVDEVVVSAGGLRLSEAGANPFSAEARLMLDLDRSAGIRAVVYDARGARVRALVSETMGAGSHLLRWDGRDDSGTEVASGIYYLNIAADGVGETTHRLVRLR